MSPVVSIVVELRVKDESDTDQVIAIVRELVASSSAEAG